METLDAIRRYRIIPQATFTGEDKVLPVIGAICSGGLPLVCIVMNRSVTRKILALAVNTFTDTYIGVKVFDAEGAELACRCGVRFICSPFFSEKIMNICRDYGIRYIPGCLTPTEIHSAASAGADAILISPSYIITPSMLERYIAESPHIKFIADCPADPYPASDYAAISRLLGVIDPTLTAGTLDETAAGCRDAVNKYSSERY